MEVRKTYVCERCGAEYLDEEECKACEAKHCLPEEGQIVDGTFEQEEIYPRQIVVEFHGRKVPYYTPARAKS